MTGREAPPGARILGLDPGTERIGVAVSDELLLAAHGLESLPARPAARVPEAVNSLIRDYNIAEIVVGLPVNMDGSLGPGAEAARALAGRLEALLPGRVCLVDERLTTIQAERALLEGNVSRRRRRGLRDRLAAVLILQGHLDARRAASGD